MAAKSGTLTTRVAEGGICESTDGGDGCSLGGAHDREEA